MTTPTPPQPFNASTVILKDSNLIEASAGTGKTYSIAIMALRLVIEHDVRIQEILMVTFTEAAVAELELRVRAFIRLALKVARGEEISDTTITAIVKDNIDRLSNLPLEERWNMASQFVKRISAQQTIDLLKPLHEDNGVSLDDTALTNIVHQLEKSDQLPAAADLSPEHHFVLTCLDKATIERRLYDAQLFLDETSVLTIHSFCQRVLNEYSFETNQIFGADAISPDEFNQLVNDAFNEYWRKFITTLDTDVLTQLISFNFERKKILDLVIGGLSGKKPAVAGPLPANFLTTHFLQSLRAEEENAHLAREQQFEKIQEQLVQKNPTILAAFVAYPEDKKKFKQLLRSNDNAQLIPRLVDELDEHHVTTCVDKELIGELSMLKTLLGFSAYQASQLFLQIGLHAFQYVENEVSRQKTLKNKITFDDMIRMLYEALEKKENSDTLAEKLNHKYKAVFIDEFQDTDKFQYHIFKTLFHQKAILFYIGDPKQSIYAWRQADLKTYFTAAEEVDHRFTMNVNFRSSASYISGMNQFFLPNADFDTFAFGASAQSIKYICVDSPNPNTKGRFVSSGPADKPIIISRFSNKKKQHKNLVKLVYELLHGTTFNIEKDGVQRRVKPEDIGILVRSNREGKAVKSLLSSAGIPSITINDSKLFDSQEAKEVFYVMMAVYNPSMSNINRCLLTRLGGYSNTVLGTMDQEAITMRFRKYNESWKEEGVFVMFRKFLSDHDLFDQYYLDTIGNPDRMISNVLQLVEVIHKISERKNFDPFEQIQWLKKGMDGEIREGDEYQQQLETDEAAVRIVTIHKSKGLEYNIVIAPCLDSSGKLKNQTLFGYRHPDGDYLVAEKNSMSAEEEQWFEEQLEQENRRLLYVAITRARYQCFIIGSSRNDKASPLQKFTPHLCDLSEIQFNDTFLDQVTIKKVKASATSIDRTYAVPASFELKEKNWRKASYSGLSADHQSAPTVSLLGIGEDSYDHFIYRDLRKGAQTGNLLHYIFENINFTSPDHWGKIIKKAIRRLASPKSEEFLLNLERFLHHILNVNIPLGNGFRLADIPSHDRLNELEFDFPLKKINPKQLETLSSEEAPLKVKGSDEMQGIMNGKIDLLFRHNNKYYILDWKSNYLGDTADAYGQDAVKRAMDENNYHLQYHIYAVAAWKYLDSRIADFDYDNGFGGVIYLFVRGVRENKETGFFIAKPPRERVEALSQMLSGH